MGKEHCLLFCGFYSWCLTDHFKGLKQAFEFFVAFRWRFLKGTRQGLSGNNAATALKTEVILSSYFYISTVPARQEHFISLKKAFVGVTYQVFPILDGIYICPPENIYRDEVLPLCSSTSTRTPLAHKHKPSTSTVQTSQMLNSSNSTPIPDTKEKIFLISKQKLLEITTICSLFCEQNRKDWWSLLINYSLQISPLF